MFADKMIHGNQLHLERVENKTVGYSFQVRIPFYRSVPLSCVVEVEVAMDGQEIDPDALRFDYEEQTYKIAELAERMDVWWGLLKPARVIILDTHGIESGHHELDLKLKLRWPILIPTDTDELPNYDTNVFKKTMVLV